MIVRRLTQILAAKDLDVVAAQDGLEALRLVQEDALHLVIADIMMPRLSGLELAQWMRRNPRLRSIPILFCSCLSEVGDILSASQLDRVDYLLKPVDGRDLMDKIDQLLDPNRPHHPPMKSSPPASSRHRPEPVAEPPGSESTEAGGIPAAAVQAAAGLTIPTLTSHRQTVLELVDSPMATTHDFARVATIDPGLATTVIRLVNGTLSPLGKQVSSVADACVIIGIRNLRSLCLSAALSQEQFKDVEPLIARCWRHSIATSQLAARFASLVAPKSERDVSLAALLHGIGLIALLASPEHDLLPMIETADGQFCDLSVVERVQLGYHHADVARALTERWRFRNRICEIVGSMEASSRVTSVDAWCVLMASLALQIHDSDFVHRAHPEELWEFHGEAHPAFRERCEERLPTFLKESAPQIGAR